MTNILITGGAGFIGSNLSNYLYKKGFKITIIDNLERGNKKNLNSNIKLINYDLRKNPKKIENYFKKSEIVIHLASKVGSWKYYEDNAFEVFQDNALIDSNVINLINKFKITKYIYASSSHVYPSNLQTQKKKYILKENDSKDSHPLLSYGWAKLIAEKQIINLSNKIKNSKFVILRFVGIYGSNQNTNIEKGSIIPVLCKRASNYPKSEYKILTNGEEVRSYCHIDDTCNCIFKLILKINKINKYETFNVCSSQKIKIKDIAKKIILISKKKIILKIPKKKPQVSPSRYVQIKK